MEKIKSINSEHVQNYKGGIQKTLSVKNGGEVYHIVGNTDNQESRELYEQLKEEMAKIIFPELH